MSPDKSTDQSNRHSNGSPVLRSVKDGHLTKPQEQNVLELAAKARAQEVEISLLRQQISEAYLQEMRLLNEKYALEGKFADLRMALDEKHKESIDVALKELADRRGDLNEFVRLTNDLKDVEDQRYIFMTSLLGLLAEHGIWPTVANASSISMYVKWKLQATAKELSSINGNFTPVQNYDDNSQPEG